MQVSRIRFPLSVLFALVGLTVVHMCYFYPQLPETVASHFDASGVPNGWMSKSAFVVIMGFVTIISVGSTAGIALLVPNMRNAINLPNKDYWFSSDRRDETMAFIASSMLWIACAVLLLLLIINFYVFKMNIEKQPGLDLPMIPTLAVFLTAIGSIVTRMIMRFRKTNTTTTYL